MCSGNAESIRKGYQMPRVSIITLCHNDEQYLPECIDSVQAQTYRDFEHIIVDVASVSPVQSRTYRLAVDPGIASSRNHGVAASSGQFVMQLDADDKIAPNYLEKVIPLAGQGIIVCPGLQEFDGHRGTYGPGPHTDSEIVQGASRSRW